MLNIISRPPMYDPEAVQHMRDELVAVGFTELLTPEEVDKAINVKDDKTVLVMVNSVCGCAAGSARPGVSLALQNNKIPDKLYTVFAGMERDAVDRARQYVAGFPPSSPSVALFKNGSLIYFMPRYEIEGRSFSGKRSRRENKDPTTGLTPHLTHLRVNSISKII